MVMIVKRGRFPDPTWENRLMQLFPQGVQWGVRMEGDGFYAQVQGETYPFPFADWGDALKWVGFKLGISQEQLHDALQDFPAQLKRPEPMQ